MNRIRLVLYTFLLVTSLSVGAWIGFYFGNRWQQQFRQSDEDANSITQHTGQRSILLIGVDQIAETARLEGVWYIAYIPGNPNVVLVPIYPDLTDPKSDQDVPLIEFFRMNRQGNVVADFYEAVERKYGFKRSNYILIDEIALMNVVDLLGGVDLGEGLVNGSRAVEHLPRPWENLRGALEGQAHLAAQLCLRLKSQRDSLVIDPIFDLSPQFLRTDLRPEQIVEDHRLVLSSGDDLKCEFLTLEKSSP